MSVTMAKTDGVTVFTLTSDPNSTCPPLCQIFKGLCYSPVCCSVSQPLRRLQGTSQSVLGALQVIVGILTIGLGTILKICTDKYWWAPVFPFWLGSLFIFFGIMCILSEKFPSPCLVIFNVILNLIGIGFSITAIVLSSLYLAIPWGYYFSRCDSSRYWTEATESPELQIMIKKCEENQHLIMIFMKSMYILLTILSVLEFCVTISSVVLGIKALRKRGKEQNKVPGVDRMSVTMAKADGVPVFTLNSDPNSACPPRRQIFKGLCYSPVCCSVSQPLRRLQGTSQSVLGALQVIVGILTTGLGAIVYIHLHRHWWTPVFPLWLGSLFIFFGIMCILSEKFPSPCLVIFNVILNLIGIGFSITAIVFYSFFLEMLWWRIVSECELRYSGYSSRYWKEATESPELQIMIDKCEEDQHLIMIFLKSIYILLTILSVLEFCVTISSVVLGIKALRKRGKEQNKSSEVPEHSKDILEDATTNVTV